MVLHSHQSMRAGAANHLAPSQTVSQSPCHHPAAFTLGTEEGHFVSAKRLGCLEKRYVYWTFLQGVGQNQRNRTRPCFLDPACWVGRAWQPTRKRTIGQLHHHTTPCVSRSRIRSCREKSPTCLSVALEHLLACLKLTCTTNSRRSVLNSGVAACMDRTDFTVSRHECNRKATTLS